MLLITKLLIANRGEIAVRIIKTCREMGIATVAVFSEADEHAPHVRLADEVVFIGRAPAHDSYLNMEKIITAALRTGAQAIHPGYGFLAENPLFAERVVAAGLIFIGPPASAMRQMAHKQNAKKLVMGLWLPVVPGYDGQAQYLVALREAAERIGYPVLLKAAAGGGGLGQRVVWNPSELETAVAAAEQEARQAFGDDTLIMEKFFRHVRHIEIQIMADQAGVVVYFPERECSLQRRRQKIIEETPSPNPAFTDELRAEMGHAAVAIAQAVGYVGVGTVEFLVDDTNQYYFLEMNTRLQVEHPITEAIAEMDLVRTQIELAQGASLSWTQDGIYFFGRYTCAIEARIYAEDPAHDFRPSAGQIIGWQPPTPRPDLRVESGIEQGTAVPADYDPLLLKIIAMGVDRAATLRLLVRALQETVVQGVATNIPLLLGLLQHPRVQAGELHTELVAELFPATHTPPLDPANQLVLLAVALVWHNSQPTAAPRYDQPPRATLRTQWVVDGSETIEISHSQYGAQQWQVQWGTQTAVAQLVRREVEWLTVRVDGWQQRYHVVAAGAVLHIHAPMLGAHTVGRQSRFGRAIGAGQGGYTAAMPGRVVQVLVGVGDVVSAGQVLMVLESMKMEHVLCAAEPGTIAQVHAAVGDAVNTGDVLVEMAPK